MRACLHPLPLLLPCAALLAAPFTHAQTVAGSVRIEYADVLRVEPVHLPVPPPDEAGQCAPMLPLEPDTSAQEMDIETGAEECIPFESGQAPTRVQVLYDVDYVLRGIKYRTRLPYDPGNRVQVRLSVTPLLPDERP